MSNTITAYFKGRVGVAESVYQNDYGMVMNFDSIDLPAHFDCYFSILNQEEAIPGVGADRMVAIPNSVLANPGAVTIHIPLHTSDNDSEVEYVVYFKVIGRARPIDDGTPAQMTAIEQALALLQNPITNIEQIVNEALDFTGDTFDEMQAKLDADQAAFQSDMGDRATTFENGIRSRQTQVESDFTNLNAQFQTAVSALTVNDELLNVRVGDDNVTYTTAGEAVRKQFSNVKSELTHIELRKEFSANTSGGHNFSFDFVQGQKYKITNGSSVAVSLVIKQSGTTVQTVSDSLRAGGDIFFTASGNANTLNVYGSSALSSIVVEDLSKEIPSMKAEIESLVIEKDFSAESGRNRFDFSFISGQKYIFTNNSSSAISLTTRLGVTEVDVITDGLASNAQIEFTATGDADNLLVYCASAISLRIDKYWSIYDTIEDIENDVAEQTLLKSFSTNASGTYRFGFLFTANMDYVITNKSASAISIETNLNNATVQTLTDNLPANKQYRFTATANANQLKVYCGSAISISIEKLLPSFVTLDKNVTDEIEAMSEDVEEVKDIAESMQGMASVAYVDSAIASASLVGSNVTAVVNTKGRSMRPIVTFTDDDCRAEVYTLLKPILDSKNVHASLALEAGEIGGSGYMTSSQLIEMVTNGHGLMFHGYDEINFTQVTISELTRQLNLSLAKLDDWGIDRGVMSTVAYPQGSENLAIRTWASGHFKAGLDVFRDGINHTPFGQFVISRVNFGEANNPTMKSAMGSPYDTNTLDFYKWCVDKAIAENGWLIFMSHAWMSSFDATQQGYLADLIDYIRSKFVDIMTVDEAIECVGNLVTVGDYNKPYVCETNYFVVGCDGAVESDMTANVITRHGAFNSDSLPAAFPLGKIINTPISYAESQAHTYPGNTYGGLTTHTEFYRFTDYPTPYYDAVYQTYITANGAQYIRFANSDGASWKAWKQISIV